MTRSFPRRRARVRLHIYRRTILQWSLHHALQALKLGYEILFLAFFGLAVAVTLAVVAPLALPGRKTLFLAIDLPSLAVNREVHDKLRAAVAPAQGQQLVAENAPLKHVREYLANTLHPHKRKFTTERAGFQVVKDPKDRSKLALAINGQPIGEWFKEQFCRLFSFVRKTVEPLRKGNNMGL